MDTIPQLQCRSVAAWDGTYTFSRRIPFVRNLIFSSFCVQSRIQNSCTHFDFFFFLCTRVVHISKKIENVYKVKTGGELRKA
jgi:hypothetical protein